MAIVMGHSLAGLYENPAEHASDLPLWCWNSRPFPTAAVCGGGVLSLGLPPRTEVCLL